MIPREVEELAQGHSAIQLWGWMRLGKSALRLQVLKLYPIGIVNGCKANGKKKPKDHWMTYKKVCGSISKATD